MSPMVPGCTVTVTLFPGLLYCWQTTKSSTLKWRVFATAQPGSMGVTYIQLSISQNPEIFGKFGNSSNASISSTDNWKCWTSMLLISLTMPAKMTGIVGYVRFYYYLRQFRQITENVKNLCFRYLRQCRHRWPEYSDMEAFDIFDNSGRLSKVSKIYAFDIFDNSGRCILPDRPVLSKISKANHFDISRRLPK